MKLHLVCRHTFHDESLLSNSTYVSGSLSAETLMEPSDQLLTADLLWIYLRIPSQEAC
jgi:hypothetical protein